MKFLVTIDTEGDNLWDHGRKLGVENIKFVPRFQALCEKYNIRPTYLVTSEVCEDPYAREIFTGYIIIGLPQILNKSLLFLVLNLVDFPAAKIIAIILGKFISSSHQASDF